MKTIIFAGIVITFLYLIGANSAPRASTKALQPFQEEAARNFEAQYHQVKDHGTQAEVCVRAGLVAEGYLQAQDNVNFAKWADIKSAECKKAGLPQ